LDWFLEVWLPGEFVIVAILGNVGGCSNHGGNTDIAVVAIVPGCGGGDVQLGNRNAAW
jgi:uncharacterized membrane protein